MTERWRKPIIPIAIEQETTMVKHQSGFTLPLSVPRLVLEHEDVLRIANGYACLNCLEPWEHPYPEKCPACSYPARKLQALEFERDYMGREAPVTPLEEKLAALDEQDAKEVHVPGSQILVPKGVKLAP